MGDEHMKKLIVIGLTALAGVVASIGVAPAAHAYPEAVCTLVVSAQVVNSGDEITATCSLETTDSAGRSAADSDTEWEMTFNGETRTGTGSSFTATFTAPEVSERTELTLLSVGVNGETTCQRTATITVLPAGDQVTPPDDGLPGTGGPRLALLFAGVGLVLAGGVAIRQSRKGNDVPVA